MKKRLHLAFGLIMAYQFLAAQGNQGANDWGPTPSPDGKKIVFYSTRNGNDLGRIFKMNADGSNLQEMDYASTGGHDIEPTWSPSGDKIAFTSQRNFDNGGVSSSIYIMNSDGSNVTEIYDHDGEGDGATHFGSWINDQEILFFFWKYGGFEPNIYKIKLDGSGLKQLTDDNASYQPRFAANRVWFASTRTGNAVKYNMNIDGSDVIEIDEVIGQPHTHFFASENNIYFVQTNDQKESATFYIRDNTTQTVTKLTTTDHVPAYFMAASDQGNYILFNFMGSKNHDIMKIDLTNGKTTILLQD